MRILAAWLVGAALCAQPSLDFLNHNHPVLDAHNCYPYKGRWSDRIERALKTGFPVAIEQDITLYDGRPVVSHSDKPTGAEPTLREHFFERVRPLMESALAANDRARWPLIILHFDFKSVQPELLRAVWKLLGEYEPWLTTAPKTADPRELAAFDRKPLLVLTEDADEQEAVFFRALPAGAKLRVFGSAHKYPLQARSQQESWHQQATLAPQALLPDPPTNYRRWWNNSWYAVEEGGQRRAGEWTAADDRRLRALVDHAHKMGYWIRFYTLDGYTPDENRGWDDNYNFGSRVAVEARWQAAIAAGVDLIATDQYEDLAAFSRRRR
jgi:glycerophosphoryl diester phosphodiesterase